MIREVLSKTFEKHISLRYIRDLSFQPQIETLYTKALYYLNSGDTEKSITYIILALEEDINYIPIHHLSRTMLFSLSDEFIKKKGLSIKEKHHNLNKYLYALENKLSKQEKELVVFQNDLSKTEEALNKGFSLMKLLNKKSYTNKVNLLNEEINKLNSDIKKTKKDIWCISDLCKIEEYIKIISLVLEVSNYPKRFSLSIIS